MLGHPPTWSAASLCALLLLACVPESEPLTMPGSGSTDRGAGGDDATTSPDDDERPDDEADLLEGPCPLGATRACKVDHETGCAAGSQYCPDGTWTGCFRDVQDSLHRRARTDAPPDCGADGTSANVCDPRCHAFAPEPPTMSQGGGTVADWEVGSIGQLPAAALDAALEQPCSSSRDCQLDHRCDTTTRSCVPYVPGEGNPTCGADYDVTAGVPCGDTVPICNRGNAPIAAADLASFRIKYRKPPPYLMDGCAMGGPEGTCTVPASAPLEVGECRSVPCAVPPGRVVYVDAGNGNSRECECGNNWTFDGGGSCQAPSCGGSVSIAEEVKLSLFLSIDTSGSMDWHRSCPHPHQCSNTSYCASSGWFKNCNGSCSNGVCSTGTGPGNCCWPAPSGLSRWDAVHGALASFVADPASAGLGVAMKFWPEGTCQGNACEAVEPFAEATTCAFDPCVERATDTATGDTLAASCSPDVAEACADNPRCCGTAPKGTCSSSPCEARASGTLPSSCLASAGGSNICSGANNVDKRCCGGWTGTCSSDPCGTYATHLGSCDNSSNAAVRATCDQIGFERCCGGDMATTGAWGLDQAPCAVANGNAMRCRNANGGIAACASVSPPAGTRAAVAKAVCAASPSCCSSGWTSECVTAFDTQWKAAHGGASACSETWDASCRDEFLAQAGPKACTKVWDQECADAYEATAGDACTVSWDDECVDDYLDAGGACAGDSTACNHPSVPVDCADEGSCQLELTSAQAPGDTSEKRILDRLADVEPVGGTPSAIAVEGAADFCARYQEKHPDERCVVVFVSDGQPSQCGGESDVWSAAQAGFADGVYTYAVGISGAGTSFMNTVAQRGGTSAAFFVSPNETASDDLLRALEDIRKTFACSYSVAAGTDPDLVTVRWNDGGANPLVRRVADVTLCGSVTNGYYPGAADGELILCPSTCARVKAAPTSNVEVTIACEASSGPVTVTEELRAVCTELGTFPRWTVLLHAADVPEGSSIRIRARTALREGDDYRSWHDVATLTHESEEATLDAPVDVAGPLGIDAFGELIELELASTVDGGAPELLGYEVQYTCADTE